MDRITALQGEDLTTGPSHRYHQLSCGVLAWQLTRFVACLFICLQTDGFPLESTQAG